MGRRPGGGPRGRGPDRQGLRQRRRPAPRLGPLRRQVLHARDDGHGPQPRPERGDAPRDGRPDRQRAVRLGRLPALHPDVRADRHGGEAGALRRGARGEEARPRRRAGHRADGGRPARARRRVQGDRPGRHRARLPERPVRAAGPRDQGRLRVVVRQARDGLPEQPAHRPRPRHRGQRRDHGLRQHGRRLGHRGRLHARPEHRREDPLRRVPHQRPGRGRRRRHPDRAEDRPDADRHARGLQRVPADRPAARAPLPRRPGPRVHDRARQAVHAPDALGEADRRGGRADRHGPRRRGPHHEGRGARPDRAGPRRPAPARPVRPGGPDRGHAPGQGAQRVARRGRRQGGVRRGHRGRVGGQRRARRPGPDRDVARRLPRHGRRPGHPDRPRWRHQPRRGGRPPDRQAVRGRLSRAAHRLRGRDGRGQRRPIRPGRLDQPRRLDRRGLPRPVADGLRPVRGPARAPDDPRLGRRGPPHGGLDQRRQARGGGHGPPLRRPGHRPVPDGAHVPGGRAARDRARRDPRRRRSPPGPRHDERPAPP